MCKAGSTKHAWQISKITVRFTTCVSTTHTQPEFNSSSITGERPVQTLLRSQSACQDDTLDDANINRALVYCLYKHINMMDPSICTVLSSSECHLCGCIEVIISAVVCVVPHASLPPVASIFTATPRQLLLENACLSCCTHIILNSLSCCTIHFTWSLVSVCVREREL
jgi:hypothetical protein